jgi:hypothetical protein
MNRIKRNKIAASALSCMLAWSVPMAAEVDLSGRWAARYHEDWQERLPSPEIGDYTGLPINDAARAKADAWEESIQTQFQRQCPPHSAAYNLHGPSNLRIWSEPDPISGQILDWRVYGPRQINYTIWVDGRPHPSQNARHSSEGFTTGHWEGDTLITFTDHIKVGYLRRNGIPHSDLATETAHWMRHGDILTVTSIVEDPVYLTQPLIRSTNWQIDPAMPNPTPIACEPGDEVERPRGVVPHYLPGTNPFLGEVTRMHNIPLDAARGGEETMYPEYRKKLKDKYVAPEKCDRYCCGWVAPLPNGIPPGLNCNQYCLIPTGTVK